MMLAPITVRNGLHSDSLSTVAVTAKAFAVPLDKSGVVGN